MALPSVAVLVLCWAADGGSNVPDFNLKPSFPIADVINAAQRKSALEQQAKEQGNAQLLQGIQSIGQVGQNLVDKRMKVARSLALGRQLGIPDDQSRLMEPEDVVHTATIRNKIPDVLQTMLLANPKLASDEGFLKLAQQMSLQSNPTASPTQAPAQGAAAQPNPVQTAGLDGATSPASPAGPPATSTGTVVSTPADMIQTLLKKPITAATASSALKIAHDNRQVPVMTPEAGLAAGSVPVGTKFEKPGNETGGKADHEQDILEQNALNRIASVRGDASIARIETQRDAASIAFNTIQQAKNEGRDITQTEYYDTLGQLWKARTGAAPTDQSIRDLDINTIQAALHKKLTWVDGKPRGATSKEIIDSLQKFVDDSGKQADKLHEGYMKPRLIKPFGLSEERWKAIQASGRGLSYSDATKESRQASAASHAGGLSTEEQAFITNYEAKHGIK